jgi:hypothetical protein
MRTTSGVVGGQRLHKNSWKMCEERRADGQTDRRKKGVNREKAGCNPKNNRKILLTENGRHTILRLRQSLPSLKRSDVPPLSARRKKTVNEEYRCRHN